MRTRQEIEEELDVKGYKDQEEAARYAQLLSVELLLDIRDLLDRLR